MENKKDIGDIFKARLDNQQTALKGTEWKVMQKKLKKKRFFRFSFQHFNIFYSLLISGTLISGIAIMNPWKQTETDKAGIKKEKLSPEAPDNNQTPRKSESKTSEKIQKNTKPDGDVYNKIPDDYSSGDNKSQTDAKIEVTIKSDTISKIDMDGEMKNNDEKADKSNNVITKEKIIYVVEQDTIVKYDTVVKKNRKKRFIFGND